VSIFFDGLNAEDLQIHPDENGSQAQIVSDGR